MTETLQDSPRLILASSSPRRSDLLKEHGYVFETVPARVEEVSHQDLHPEELVLENAQLKARSVASAHPDAIVLGVDTIVAFEGETFGKPANMAAALRMLQRLNGRAHEVYSGVCIAGPGSVPERYFWDLTRVYFHERTDEQLETYLKRISPLDKAGSYSAQDDDGEMIERIEGSLTNVVGLPMEKLKELLPPAII